MNQQNDQATYGYGFADRSGPYLVRTRKACVELVNPTTAAEMRANVTGCILHKFTELDKALFSSRQYILTLWPAFVGAIVALAPDPSIMVYDNIWWSVLFAITSGGLPGMESASPPHHVDAISEREGQALCEAWHFDPSRPQIMSKEKTMGSYTRGKGFILFEWASFFLSVVLWLYFCVRFGQTLKLALDMTFESEWLAGALWYYISASPAVIGLVLELIRNRVDLYEPANRIEGEMEASRKAEEGRIRSLVE
jgi:hypothetical protein